MPSPDLREKHPASQARLFCPGEVQQYLPADAPLLPASMQAACPGALVPPAFCSRTPCKLSWRFAGRQGQPSRVIIHDSDSTGLCCLQALLHQGEPQQAPGQAMPVPVEQQHLQKPDPAAVPHLEPPRGSSQPGSVQEPQQGRTEAEPQPKRQPQPAGGHLQVCPLEWPRLCDAVSCSLVYDACMTSTSGQAQSTC